MTLSKYMVARGLIVALCCIAPFCAPWAQAQTAAGDYPNRPIKFIVPYSPGGLGDSFARAISEGLSERLGQPVVVENMPGASQAVGAAAAAKAPADGYTVFMGTQSGLVLNTLVRKKLPYDPVKDFAPVSMLFSTPFFLVTHPSLEAKSVAELIALAKAKPGHYSVATIGEGTGSHLISFMFESRAKVAFLKVPYKGSAQAITDVLGGTVDMMFEGGASALPHVRQGTLRLLASTAERRSETDHVVPGLPTLNDTFPGLAMDIWFSMVVPAGVPRSIIDRLNAEIKQVQRTPKLQKMADSFGAKITESTPEQLGTRLRAQLEEYAKVMKEAGVQSQ